MKIDNLNQQDLYGDLRTTTVKSVQDTKRDFHDESGSGPVMAPPVGPFWLRCTKGLLAVLTVILLFYALVYLSVGFVWYLWVGAVLAGGLTWGAHVLQHRKA